MFLRLFMCLTSAALHAAVGLYAVRDNRLAAYVAGTGASEYVIEQGIGIESHATSGPDRETVQAVEAEPMEVSEARPETEEVKAEEPLEDTKVITSSDGPEQEAAPEEIKEAVEKQKQDATLQQETEVPFEERRAASIAQSGGEATALRAYAGKLHAHLMKKVVRPRGGQRTGKVVVRFTIGPSGQLLSREILESSGIKGLDEAALATVEKAAPFPPIPVEVADGPLVRTVPFNFRVQ
jgi:protein TonB